MWTAYACTGYRDRWGQGTCRLSYRRVLARASEAFALASLKASDSLHGSIAWLMPLLQGGLQGAASAKDATASRTSENVSCSALGALFSAVM